MPSKYSEEQLAAAKDKIPEDVSIDENYDVATRALGDMKVEANFDNIRLWLALRMLKLRDASSSETKTRVTKKLFDKHRVTLQDTSSVSQTFWMVSKKELASPIGKVYDPRSVATFPRENDPTEWWVFSSKVSRSQLPDDGVYELKSSATVVRELPLEGLTDSSSVKIEEVEDEPSVVQGSGLETDTAVAVVAPLAAEPAAPSSLLKKHDSNPDEQGDKHWADVIVDNMEECLNADQLVPAKGAADSTYAIYWFQSFWENVDHMKHSGVEESDLPTHVKRLPSYVAYRLLHTRFFHSFKPFVAFFRKCEAAYEGLVNGSPSAISFCKLSEADLCAEEPFDTSFLSQWPDRKNAFQTCPAFLEYQQLRSEKRVDVARQGADMPVAKRDEIIQEALSRKDLQEECRKELVAMQTMMSPLPHEEKLEYALADPQRFVWLMVWLPTDGRMLFEPFSRTDRSFDGVSIEKFRKAAGILIQSERLVKAIRHPFAQALLKDWRASVALAKSRDPVAGSDPSILLAFVEAVFLDLGVLKLGLKAPESQCDIEAPSMPPDVCRELMKIVNSHHKKAGSEPGRKALISLVKSAAELGKKPATAAAPTTGETPQGTVAAQTDGEAELPAAAPAAAVAAQNAAAKMDVGDNAGKEQGDTSKTVASVAEGSQDNAGKPSYANVQVGTKLRSISGNRKAEMDNKLVTVTVVNQSSLWVKFEEGPLKGTEAVKRTYAQVKFEQPSCSEVPAAGKKRPLEKAAVESESAKKAAAIFAKYSEGSGEPL